MSAAVAAIDTKRVTERRKVRYESFDDLLVDVERMASQPHRTLGNWTYPQILDHLTRSSHSMIDGGTKPMAMPVRWFLRLTMFKQMTQGTMPAGFQIPQAWSQMLPTADELPAAIAALREAIARVRSTSQRAMHPGFGTISREAWDGFQLRHSEMHMSFVVPMNA